MKPVAPPIAVEATDEDLVRMLQTGQADAALVGIEARYGKRIQHFVHGMVRDHDLALDVAQEVFEKVLLKHELYKPGTNFRAWLFEVARNQALSALRAQKRLPRPVSNLNSNDERGERDLLDSIAAGQPDRRLEEEEFMTAFHAAVAELPAHYQTVFDLCVRQGRPYQEAGEQLGLPTGTVAIRIMRARKRLFGTLQRHLDRLRRPPACFQ
jgi:RNA polymerase sigma-70 factor, ECF subfamily